MNVKSRIGQLVGESINAYNNKLKPIIEEVELREKYQSRIIECMIGEVDDNYIETPEVTESVFKLEYSKEGLVKLPTIKGKTILVDADGNETSTPGEGCRLMSVGEKEDNKLIISSKNKNLFDEKNFIEKNTNCWHYIDISNLSSIIFNGKGYASLQYNYSKLEFYTTNKLPIGNAYDEWKLKGTIDVPYNAEGNLIFNVNNNLNNKYLVVFQASTNLNNYVFKEFSVTAEVPTNYIEPRQHKTEILLDEPLRKINNDIYDEIVGNKLIRKIGRVILNGTEGYEEYVEVNNRLQNVIGYFTQINDIKKHAKTLCNLLPSSLFDEKDTIGCKVGGSPHIHLYFSREIITSKDEFIQYISENPIEVLYELAEPIIEELPNSIALQCFDDTTMYIENSITPTVTYGYNALIPYKEELAKQREEVDNNVLDIETNIIPYLTEIEYNLNRMEGN